MALQAPGYPALLAVGLTDKAVGVYTEEVRACGCAVCKQTHYGQPRALTSSAQKEQGLSSYEVVQKRMQLKPLLILTLAVCARHMQGRQLDPNNELTVRNVRGTECAKLAWHPLLPLLAIAWRDGKHAALLSGHAPLRLAGRQQPLQLSAEAHSAQCMYTIPIAAACLLKVNASLSSIRTAHGRAAQLSTGASNLQLKGIRVSSSPSTI